MVIISTYLACAEKYREFLRNSVYLNLATVWLYEGMNFKKVWMYEGMVWMYEFYLRKILIVKGTSVLTHAKIYMK